MGQWPRSTTATTLPQPSAIGLTQRLVGLRSHLLFRGLTRQSSAEWGRGKGEQGLLSLDLEIHSPLTCIAHYQVVPISTTSSCWASQTHLRAGWSRKWVVSLWSTQQTRCEWDFTGAETQMDEEFTWPRLFCSNLFLNGVVILIGEWATQLGKNNENEGLTGFLRLHGHPPETWNEKKLKRKPIIRLYLDEQLRLTRLWSVVTFPRIID